MNTIGTIVTIIKIIFTSIVTNIIMQTIERIAHVVNKYFIINSY